MTTRIQLPISEQPKAVVLAAYGEANRGRFSKANAFLAPGVTRDLIQSRASAVAGIRRLRQRLAHIKGRRDSAAVRVRRLCVALIKSYRVIIVMRVGSSQFLRDQWNGVTRGRSLLKIEATRQVIRGSRARVYLRLTRRDGTVVRESEPLVLRHGKWLLG